MESSDMELSGLKTKVDLIAIGDALEAIALMSVLESFGVEVRCHFVASVKKLISFLNGNEFLHKTVIISCHGDEKGMILPELTPELENTMPYRRVLSASDCTEFLELKDQVIINTGCCLGKDGFAKSFIQGGASAYVGFETYPEGNAVVLFVISFLYFFICQDQTLRTAFKKAKSLDERESFVKLHEKKS